MCFLFLRDSSLTNSLFSVNSVLRRGLRVGEWTWKNLLRSYVHIQYYSFILFYDNRCIGFIDWLTIAYENYKEHPEVLDIWKWIYSISGKKADRMEVGLSSNDRPKRAENKSDGHHASSYHRFRDIQLQYTSVRLFYFFFRHYEAF